MNNSKKNIFFILFISAFGSVFGQNDDTQRNSGKKDTVEVKLDMLSAPQSPAGSLLGFAESEIIKPENPTDFIISFQNATTNFTEPPASFAADFRLWQFFSKDLDNFEYVVGQNKKLDSTINLGIVNNIKQTTILSLGYKNFDVLKDTVFTGQGLGIGFKTSLFRGKKMNKPFQQFKNSEVLQDSILKLADKKHLEQINEDEEKQLNTAYNDNIEKIDAEIDSIKNSKTISYESKLELIEHYYKLKTAYEVEHVSASSNLKSEFTTRFNQLPTVKETYEKIAKELTEEEFRTYGFVLDVAGGLVLNFPDNRFGYSVMQKAALWTVMGYEAQSGFSALGLLKSSYNMGSLFENKQGQFETKDVIAFDFGARVIYDMKKNGFSLSAELIGRSILDQNINTRMTLNLGYKIRKNTRLSFVFGKDFDNNYTLENNLISALNLSFGFGSKKYIKFSEQD